MNKRQLAQARSRVINKYIAVETLLHQIITIHYFGQLTYKEIPFILEVWNNPLCDFGLRRSVFERVVTRFVERTIPDKKKQKATIEDWNKRLRKLNKCRNLFAHCGPITYKNKMGERVTRTLDPEKYNSQLDFKSKYDDFMKDYPLVIQDLELFKRQLEKDIQDRRRA